MKRWTTEQIDNLRILAETKTLKELGEIFEKTPNAIKLKLLKLHIKVFTPEYREIKKCLYCNKEFDCRITEYRKFCSQTCSAKNFNILLSEEVVNKRSESIREYWSKIERKPKKKYNKVNENRTCKVCDKNVLTKGRLICDDCKHDYYKYYRVECRFNFPIREWTHVFKEEELHLLKILGMYSASNKGDNKNGVSRDHLFSVKMGYNLNIPTYIINYPANCRIVKHTDNQKKYSKSIISLNELYIRILHSENTRATLNVEQLNYIKEKLVELV